MANGFSPCLAWFDTCVAIEEDLFGSSQEKLMPIVNPRILTIEVTDNEITAHLVDGRTISVPLVWSWRLVSATEKQRQHWEILGDGEGVRWPDIDEDISVNGMLYGMPAHSPRERACAR
jgi:hypothetical protein